MGTAERRKEIMRCLCIRKYETVSNLAFEFGVSERTILRDIDELSVSEPIYTQTGRYGGGVYVMDGYEYGHMYMSDRELSLLHKVRCYSEKKEICDLSSDEIKTLTLMIAKYTKPNYRKEQQ